MENRLSRNNNINLARQRAFDRYAALVARSGQSLADTIPEELERHLERKKRSQKYIRPAEYSYESRYGLIRLFPDQCLILTPIPKPREVRVRNRESQVMEVLIAEPERTHSAVDIASVIYPGIENYEKHGTGVIKVYISNLRSQIDPQLITTIPRKGYILH